MLETKRMIMVLSTAVALLGSGVAVGDAGARAAGGDATVSAAKPRVSPKCKNKKYARRFPKKCRVKGH